MRLQRGGRRDTADERCVTEQHLGDRLGKEVIRQHRRPAMCALIVLILRRGSACGSAPAPMPGPLQVPHSLPEAMNKRERDTMQRGRYIYLAMMAGVLALAGWSSRPAQAALPSTDPKVAVTATNLPAGWTAGPIGTVPRRIGQKRSVS